MGTIGFAAIDEPLDKCSCWWGITPCPNQPEFIIIKTGGQITFSIMCGPHKFGFELDFGQTLKGSYTVEPYTLIRSQELQTLAIEEGN